MSACDMLDDFVIIQARIIRKFGVDAMVASSDICLRRIFKGLVINHEDNSVLTSGRLAASWPSFIALSTR